MTNHNYFVVITAKVLLDKNLSDKQKLLLGLIANLSNERGYCFASNKYLAERLCCSEPTIRQHISDLEEKNYVGRVVKINGKGEVEFRSLTVLDPPDGNSPPPRWNSIRPPDEKPSHNNKEDNNIYSNYLFFDKQFSEVWKDFKEMRKKIKKAMTQRAEILNLNELSELSANDKYLAIKIVQQSVKHSWQTFYPIKTHQNYLQTEFSPLQPDN